MRDAQPTAIQLADYKAPTYEVTETHLRFELNDEFTLVNSVLKLRQNGSDTSFTLNGQELELLGITLDGKALGSDDY